MEVARTEFVGRRAVASGELGQHRAGVVFDVAVPSLVRDRLVLAHGHELELDVVGVSEHEYRVAALVVDRRVLDSEFGEPRRPSV